MLDSHETNLWLARALFDLGGIKFGDFTVGRTAVHSPIYVNPRLLISDPAILRRVAKLIQSEVRTAQVRRRPRLSPFDLVAGVPLGGLHLATAFSLATNIPMIYARLNSDTGKDSIEGLYTEGQSVLIIDDLITGGGSVRQTAALLEAAGLVVKDAIVLIDREQGAAEHLHRSGYNLISILKLKTMLNYYLETELIEPAWYDRSMNYLEANPGAVK